MPASNGSSGPNTIVVLLIGLVVGGVVGYLAGSMGGEEDSGVRGEWHDSPSPPGSPDRTVRMNLDQIKELNDASTPDENPMKAQIGQKLTEIMDPAFNPADRDAASLHAHNAWMFAEQAGNAPDPATKGVLWSSVHTELDEIN
ncbi:MAG: hypothetical protein ACYTHK_01545 [Planctomycetota bacterium]|jgi:hypothetical protein